MFCLFARFNLYVCLLHRLERLDRLDRQNGSVLCPVQSCPVLPVLSNPVQSCPILCPVQSCLSCPILSCPVLTSEAWKIRLP